MQTRTTFRVRPPRLLIEWEPRWRGFAGSLRVLLHRCRAPKTYTVKTGVPARAPLAATLLHFAVVFFAISMDPWLERELHNTFIATPARSANIVAADLVYVPDGLPELSDVPGAESGRTGKAGGAEFFNPKQVIRIFRGKRAVATVVDVPTLRLPPTQQRVANLVAFSAPQPPPPAVMMQRPWRKAGMESQAAVVPPPPAVLSHNLGWRLQFADPTVVPAAPNLAGLASTASLRLPAADVVPPAPTDFSRSGLRAPTSTDGIDAAVVPPPANPEGRISPRRLLELSQPTGELAHDLIISAAAGDKIGAPAGGPGALAMSPNGERTGGIGGAGNGTGTATGSATGAGNSGTGSGSADHAGEGPGNDLAAHGGSTSLPGPGGTGAGVGAVPSGITVSGGVIHLPSFGSVADREPIDRTFRPGEAPRIVIIASARAGGALNPNLAPPGERVYTVYLATRLGTAVLQYADPEVRTSFEADLVPPQPLRTEIPLELESARTVVSGVLDRLGALRDLRIVEADRPALAAKLINALREWRFRPVLRANSAIEVKAVLGFGIDVR